MRTLFGFVVIGLACGSVTAGPTLKTLPKDYDPVAKEECVVIGRFDYAFNPNKPDRPHGKMSNRLGNPTLTIKNQATRETYYIDLGGPRWEFYVALPPGKYEVTRWTSGSLTADPPAVFELASCKPDSESAPQDAVCPVSYLGTLKYARETGAGAFWKGVGTRTIAGTWEVVDEFDQALKAFQEGYPHLSCQARKSLVQLTD